MRPTDPTPAGIALTITTAIIAVLATTNPDILIDTIAAIGIVSRETLTLIFQTGATT